jgi:hypothetical protein
LLLEIAIHMPLLQHPGPPLLLLQDSFGATVIRTPPCRQRCARPGCRPGGAGGFHRTPRPKNQSRRQRCWSSSAHTGNQPAESRLAVLMRICGGEVRAWDGWRASATAAAGYGGSRPGGALGRGRSGKGEGSLGSAATSSWSANRPKKGYKYRKEMRAGGGRKRRVPEIEAMARPLQLR